MEHYFTKIIRNYNKRIKIMEFIFLLKIEIIMKDKFDAMNITWTNNYFTIIVNCMFWKKILYLQSIFNKYKLLFIY